MQEKVHGTPPTIKIFDKKPPPTSWVNVNIVQYYQIQSQVAFLRDVLSYVNQLHAEAVLQAKPSVTPALKEAFLPIPEKASPEDISNTNVYNSVLGYVKEELESLEKMLLFLQQASPEQAKELEHLLGQLKQVMNVFPKFTSEELKNLSALIDRLNQLAEKAPGETQRGFWNSQLRMIHRLMTENHANMREFQEELHELQGRMKMLSQIEELLQQINHALKATPPKPQQFLQLIENLQNLANQYAQLSPDQQQGLLAYFQQLTQFKSKTGAKLTEVGADTLVESKITEYLKAHPGATQGEIVQYLRSFLKQSNLQNSPLPFMKGLGEAIEELLEKPGFPASAGFSEIPLTAAAREKIAPNENFLNALLANLSPSPESVEQMGRTTEHLGNLFATEKQENEAQVNGFQMTLQKLKTVQQHFGKAAVGAVGKALGAGQPPHQVGAVDPSGESLPSQFQHAILDKYMPGQEKYLESLALYLYLNNIGAGFGLNLLKDMDGFGQAASTYNFNQFLHKAQDGNFQGSPTTAAHQLSHEQTALSNAMAGVSKALTEVSTDVANIDKEINSGKYDADQISYLNKMKDFLQNNLKPNLEVSKQQLSNLHDLLSKMQVNPVSGNDQEFSIGPTQGQSLPADWEKQLGHLEDVAASGDPDNAKLKPPKPIGGLVNIYTDTQNFQQSYADQGQQRQMVLQMKMTEIQQEWTVVSTALQLLNQMYMAVAQAIKGG